MNAKLVQIGNSRGVRLPRAAIAEAGLTDDIELVVRKGSITIRPLKTARAGWAAAGEELGEAALLISGGNAFDAEW